MDVDKSTVESSEWLTAEILQGVLEKYKSGVTVLNFKLESLPKSYTCKLFRIHVNYLADPENQSCTTSFIAKRKDSKVTFAADFGMIKKELSMYKYGLPKLEMILKENICPKTYLLMDETIIMEDLNMHGFKSVTSSNLLNYDQCLIGIKALAKLHAASVVLYQSDPSLVKNLGEELFYKDELYEKFHTLVENALQSLSEEVATWPESEHYEQPILNLKNKIWNLMVNLTKQNGLCVLNHGDFSLNNILFKYVSDGEICDIKIIDFQCCRYSSPVLDLQFFLSTSVNIDVIENNLTDILEFYLNTFNNILFTLNCAKSLSITELESEFTKADIIGLFACSLSLPQCLVDEEQCESLKGVNFDEFENKNTNPILRLMKLPKYREVMPRILDNFNKRGLFAE